MYNKKKILIRNEKCVIIFIIMILFTIFLFTVLSLISPYPYFWVGDCTFTWPGGSDLFMAMLASRNRAPYSEYASFNPYPPFANLLSYIFDKMVNIENVGDLVSMDFESSMQYTGFRFDNMILLIDFIILSVVATYVFIKKFICDKRNDLTFNMSSAWLSLFAICILLSFPFLLTLQKANYTILCFIFILLFLLYKDSQNRIKKTIALLSLAFAANMKLIPGVFLLLLIKERKIKETIEVIIYSIVIFILSMICFSGNFIENIRNFFRFCFGFGENPHYYHISVKAIIVLYVQRFIEHFVATGLNYQLIGSIFTYVSLLLCFYLFFITKNKISELLILSIICVFIFNSIPYNLIYLSIPFILIVETSDLNKIDVGIFIILCLLFVPIENILHSQLFNISLLNIETFCLFIMIVLKVFLEKRGYVENRYVKD